MSKRSTICIMLSQHLFGGRFQPGTRITINPIYQEPTMQATFARLNTKIACSFIIAFLCAGVSNISLAITPEQASEQVKNLPCKDNLTADQILNQSIKSHSQTDIGWHTFQEDGYFDVERAILANKGMELHYRWRVQLDGSIVPENDRTINLCSAA